jgi:hypothetical protein
VGGKSAPAGAATEADCTRRAGTKRKTRHSRVAARRDAPRGK